MLFKNIEVYNFGRYAGKNFFDTTTTPERNMILVKANNDRGKTTLFKAINFALYGEDGLNKHGTGRNEQNEEVSEWINMQRASEGDGNMYVEIKFEHENEEYRLKRSIGFRKTEKGGEVNAVGNPTVELFRNDQPFMAGQRWTQNKKDWIDTILPKDASQFFFFDGEEIQRYISSEKWAVKEAIEKVLGIKELLNAKDDLNLVLAELSKEYDKKLQKKTKDEKSRRRLVDLENDIAECEQLVNAEQVSLRGAQGEKKRLHADLEKYNAIKETLKERDGVEDKIEELKKTLKEEENYLAAARGHLGLILLSPLLNIINKTEEDPSSIDRWQSTTVKYMLHNHVDTCVCGRPIDSQAEKVLKSKVLNLRPSKESELKKVANTILIDYTPVAKQMDLYNRLEKKSEGLHDLSKYKSTLKALSEKIQYQGDVESIKGLEDEYRTVQKHIFEYERNIKYWEDKKTGCESAKKTLEDKIRASVVDGQLQKAEKRKNACNMILHCIENAIGQFYQKRKPRLENRISNTFSRLTNNPDLYMGLKIENDFSMRVVRKDGTELPTYKYSPSAGASQIVAISMIAGLNKFATRAAPVVIDTPLGRLDHVHRKNLISHYSRMSKQIIILYQPSELEEADIQTIQDHLASEWEIDSMPGQPDISQIRKTETYYE